MDMSAKMNVSVTLDDLRHAGLIPEPGKGMMCHYDHYLIRLHTRTQQGVNELFVAKFKLLIVIICSREQRGVETNQANGHVTCCRQLFHPVGMLRLCTER